MNPSKYQDYTIERLSKNNLDDVARLHFAVYGKAVPEIFLQKKYDTIYTGVQYMGLIAYTNGRVPVAYYGVIPCFLQDDNAIILSAQSVDAMTHPKYRYKGLFVKLADMLFDLCRAEGIQIIFGFPNQYSFPGLFHNSGFQIIETMDLFTIPVKTIPLEKITMTLPFLKPLYLKYTTRMLKKYISPRRYIANSVISEGFPGVFRDAGYLAYKNYHNNEIIQIGQSLIWIKINNGLLIGDMNLTIDDFDRIMTEIKKLAARLGVNQIQFQTSPHTSLHTLFTKYYKPVPSFPVLLRDIESGIALNKLKFTFADIDIF